MWDQIINVLRAEFSDVADVGQIVRILVRLLMAALLGGILGYEREQKGKAAGLRTHMLVAMGAALFVLIPQQNGMEIGDMSRVIQGVIAGIGFLGAGAIIKLRTEDDVRGLTTAAGVWMTAAIGIACGLGRESTAVLSTFLALGVLMLLPKDIKKSGDGNARDGETAVDADVANPLAPGVAAGRDG
ncbi:MgtC/SapB family protein [soil metagenome]